jgi:hypothetical protein
VDYPSELRKKDCVGCVEYSIREEENKESHSPREKLVVVAPAPAPDVYGDQDTEWPIELISLRGRRFADEEQLEQELETRDDVRGVQLDDQGFAFFDIPGNFHNEVTAGILEDFIKEKQSKIPWMSDWGFASAIVNVDLIHPTLRTGFDAPILRF